jgi:hypothetical protein
VLGSCSCSDCCCGCCEAVSWAVSACAGGLGCGSGAMGAEVVEIVRGDGDV